MFNVKTVRNDSLDQVKIGDILRANQGERIAADGVVEQGVVGAMRVIQPVNLNH